MRCVMFVLGLVTACVQVVQADELTRAVQEQLRAQGFYFGPVDGNPSSEFSTALRRYQIRHGLPVTGAVDDSTAKVLDDENEKVRRNATVESEQPAPPPSQNATPPIASALHSADADNVPAQPPGTSAPHVTGSPVIPSATPLFPSPAAAASAPASTDGEGIFGTQRVTQFIESYLRDGERQEIEPQLRYFDFPVRYFENGRVGETFVRKDTAKYVQRWPTRHYMLTDPVKVTRTGRNRALVEFTIAFSVQNGTRNSSGRTTINASVREKAGQLRITAINERRLHDLMPAH